MRVTLLDPNGKSLGDVIDARAVARLKPLRVGDRINLRVGGKTVREFEVIGRMELSSLAAGMLKFNGEPVWQHNHREHTLKLTVAPTRKKRRA